MEREPKLGRFEGQSKSISEIPSVDVGREKDQDDSWLELIKMSESIEDLINKLDNLNIDGQSGSQLAKTVVEAERFLQANIHDIVEGVLGTSEDVLDKASYVEGNNVILRASLGARVGAVHNQELEKVVKRLMKREMAEYFRANQLELAESAIKNSESVPSLLEVVKRFKTINDAGHIYGKEELANLTKKIINIDNSLNKIKKDHDVSRVNPNSEKFNALVKEATSAIGELPKSFGIQQVLERKLMAKIADLEATVLAEKISSDSQRQSSGRSLFSKVTSRVKRWFGR